MLPVNEKLKEIVQASCEFLINEVFIEHLDKHLSGITKVIHPALGQQAHPEIIALYELSSSRLLNELKRKDSFWGLYFLMASLKSCTVIPFKNPMPLLEVELIIYPAKETSLCVLYVQNSGLSMCILSHSETSKHTQ